MQKAETKIKNKERSIRKAIAKIKAMEQRMIGLEEARLFCSANRKEVLKEGCCNIKCDLSIYTNWESWPNGIGGKNDGGFSYMVLFPKIRYYEDSDDVEVILPEENLLFFEKYYQQMHKELTADIETTKRKLDSLYEEYGRLIYSYNGDMVFSE